MKNAVKTAIALTIATAALYSLVSKTMNTIDNEIAIRELSRRLRRWDHSQGPVSM
jgi:hypothetical protein